MLYCLRPLLKKCGIRTLKGQPPRIHDLRHSFACRRLLSWYRQGKNVHHLVAALSTYLGHGHVTDTYWYLTGTPELLAIAGSRFEQFAHTGQGGQA